MTIEVKLCLWCELPIDVGRRYPSEYAAIKTHYKCSSSYNHHKCAKSKLPVIPDKWCQNPKCDVKLARRDNEHLQAWIKRKFCGKSCASATGNSTRPKLDKLEEAAEKQLGLVRYTRGTPEFDRIAALYLNRR